MSRSATSWVERLRASGAYEAIDLQLAGLIQRLDPAGNAEGESLAAISAALLSYQRRRGHVCISLSRWQGRRLPGEGNMPRLPKREAWRDSLLASLTVSDGSRPTPLVLDNHGRFYLHRYWRAEQRVADRLRTLLAPAADDDLQLARLAPVFQQLFEVKGPTVDRQALAAACALGSPLTVISGGPGTGKTTTLCRILALLVAASPDDLPRIQLAAPTGKAAARMAEAMDSQIERLSSWLEQDVLSALPRRASTIHRLLGYQPSQDRFRHRADEPLTCDVLVIDEASMLDLLLMDALLAAVPPGCRVILLGDRDQLASIDAGSVFANLCTATGAPDQVSPRQVDQYRQLAGDNATLPESSADDDASPIEQRLSDAVVELTHSYRFADHPAIGALASAISLGRSADAVDILGGDQHAEVRLFASEELPRVLADSVDNFLDRYRQVTGPEHALDALGTLRILCAVRVGDFGVERLNSLIETRFLAPSDSPAIEAEASRWYRGRPVLVRANDYRHQLFNGDLGVCWPEGNANWVYFPAPDGGTRRISPARLPRHDTAWAMTIHMSQGSELDHVVLVLPTTDSALLDRELIYTGATRARQRVDIIASNDILSKAIERSTQRDSGLIDALKALSEPA